MSSLTADSLIQGGPLFRRQTNIIVVYKVDRLTRSLADFAKLVELFDAHGVSFVSVTQQFNTTTSMGRLTLNVLVSFAQFEREVTSERIRDKIAASKRKGLWVGGMVPLGYTLKDGQLHIHEQEVNIVRLIFKRYLELGSVNRLVKDLKERGFKSKIRKLASGGTRGGVPFTQGPLFYMLRNCFYLGEVSFKGEILPGSQPALLDRTLFEAVQQRLTEQWLHRTTTRIRTRALLAGLLFDDAGHRMVLTYASRDRVRHRYYVSAPCIRGRTDEPVGSPVCLRQSSKPRSPERSWPIRTSMNRFRTKRCLETRLSGFVTRIEVRRNQLAINLRSGETDHQGIQSHDPDPAEHRAVISRTIVVPWKSHQGPPERSCCRRIPKSIAPGR
nr:recombinase family protein [Nitrobacter vulgaris]